MHLLDSNIFIAAKNNYYGLDFARGFWDWIAEEFDATELRSATAVRDELLAQDDDLAEWAGDLPEAFWLEETERDLASLREVARWAMTGEPRYTQQARTDFLASADYRLISLAHAGGHTVATHEVPAPEGRRRIKFPDVCASLSIDWREPFGLFRELGLRLERPR